MNLGLEIKGLDKKAMQEKIEYIINPTSMSGLDFYEKKITRISKEDIIYFIQSYSFDSFYVEYTRGVVKKIYLAPKTVLNRVLQEEIFPERREGLDLTILSSDFLYAFIMNHDGGIFSVML